MRVLYVVYCDETIIRDLAISEKINLEDNELFRTMIDKTKGEFISVYYYYYYFDKRKTTKKLEIIIRDINNNKSERICLFTDDKELFVKFDRLVYFMTFNDFYKKTEYTKIEFSNEFKPYNKINELKEIYTINRHIDIIHHMVNVEYISKFKKFLKYNEIFNINIKKLINGTAYKNVNNFKELIPLLQSDLQILYYYQIITVRFCIIIFRLFSFNLNLSSKYIGIELESIFNNKKSNSYRFVLKNKIKNTDLNNRSFRGFKIDSIKTNEYIRNDYIFKIKLEIYNKLVANKIDKEIQKDILGGSFIFLMEKYKKEIM